MTTIYRACSDVTVVYSVKDKRSGVRVPLDASREPVCEMSTRSLEDARTQLDQVINTMCETPRKRVSCQRSDVTLTETQSSPWSIWGYLQLLFS